jgi:hypothetical protein
VSPKELEPLLGADRHDRVQRGRVLRRQPEAFEGIVEEQDTVVCQRSGMSPEACA